MGLAIAQSTPSLGQCLQALEAARGFDSHRPLQNSRWAMFQQPHGTLQIPESGAAGPAVLAVKWDS
jgi:hypothetical protein